MSLLVECGTTESHIISNKRSLIGTASTKSQTEEGDNKGIKTHIDNTGNR